MRVARGAEGAHSAAGPRSKAVQRDGLRQRAATAGWLVAVSVVIGLALGVSGSELFLVRNVWITSDNRSLQAEAADRARQLAFSTVWLPPTGDIERHIAGLPRARSVQISRELPDTLIISVEARTATAVVHEDDRYMAIDADGVCLNWTGFPPQGLPVVHIENPELLEVGRVLPDRDVGWIRDVTQGLEETGLIEGATIDLSRPVHMTVLTADGVLGKLGNERLLHEKTLLFGELLSRLKARGETPAYIDLRVLSRPTYKPLR
ncbi:MAG: cell division protein FtsQ/DivIB [Armatimonadota bacterium]